ncbi:MAG: TRAP transporter small permease [Desulfobacteraceae bacterium]|nr:MAG: TRAP transporter small permease [Desulfobacteraceae bacterium]
MGISGGWAHRLSGAAARLSTAGAVMSGVFFILMTLLTLAEVMLRTFFGSSTLVASEYSGYALSGMIYLAMGSTFKDGAHIRITFLKDRLRGAAHRAIELLCLLFAMVLCGASCRFALELVMSSYARNLTAYTVAETPLWVPQFILFLGMCVLTIQIAAMFLALATSPLESRVKAGS